MNTEAQPRHWTFHAPLSNLTPPDRLRRTASRPPTSPSAPCASVPDDEACFALWRKYGMLDNVWRHSLLVAHIATTLAERAANRGIAVNVPEVRAAALLHDIAKTYCVRHGGSHAQLGGGWAVAETRNYAVAQGVLLHVCWPWPLPDGSGLCSLPFFIIYADKRARHDQCVTLEERFEDLLTRYGHSEASRQGIRVSFEQGQTIERVLSAQLECELHEDSFDCGRMVPRT